MKTCVLLILLILLPLTSWAESAPLPRISLVEGDVMLNTTEMGEWVPAAVNTPLYEGDSLWCSDNARLEIQLPSGSRVRLDHQSQLEILNQDPAYLQLHLSQGRMFVRTSFSKEQNLQIDADDTTVLPFASTRLRIDMKPNSEEDVSIFMGGAYVEGGGSRTKVRAGELIVLEDGHSELQTLEPPDQWEQWNSERDQSLKRGAASETYLPVELKPYAADLDANGRWVHDNDYGNLWQPTTVDADWAPYRVGRWVWLRGDYVWVSYESWGWAPHHYGRWISLPGRGWYWLPPTSGDVFWSPGNVGWLSFGVSVGWVPLAPRETYYGYGNYGRYSVNVTNFNPGNINASASYQNLRRERSGVTIIPQNDFIKGKTVIHQVPRTSSIPVSVVLPGRPNIKPERETRMPVVRTVRHTDVRPVRTAIPENRQRFPRIAPQQRQLVQQPSASIPQERSRQDVRSPEAPASVPAAVDQPLRQKRTVFPVQSPKAQPTPALPALRQQPAQTRQSVQQERKVWRVKPKELPVDDRSSVKEQKKGPQREQSPEQAPLSKGREERRR